jgi:hypothetical protein
MKLNFIFIFTGELLMRSSLLILVLLICIQVFTALSTAQETEIPARVAPIQDNSFLIEEAYNQEDGVIQHISTFQRLTNSRDWVYTQTDEWPLRSLKHQLSVTMMATHAGSFQGSGAGWGDTAINYRYQLLGSGETKYAFAPRFTLLAPTGDHTAGRGSGGFGCQTNLPLSVQHTRRFVTHWNAGATFVPHARNEHGDASATVATNLGQSMVWLASPRVNFLVETLWTASENVVAANKTQWSHDLYVSPGIRWAYNLRNGLQVVPGIGVPIGVGPCAGEKGMIVYLSFEHPFAFAHSRR